MCGLAGWLAAPGASPEAAALERMAYSIRHRGPDDRGFHRDPAAGLALAHLRLSIIDLSPASHQPMVDGDGSGVVLAYNGELYNFRALRSELEALGHRFVSSGDTEVVLKAYLQWGPECFLRFAGMFALALWDPREAVLHLARDPLGMKPLYYQPSGDAFVFASEVKAFRELPGMRLRVSELGLRQYLEFGYVFDEQQSFLADIYKLQPGHRMEVRAGVAGPQRAFFSAPSLQVDARDEAQRLDELRDVLEQVVAEHLIADVPIGLLLSGGLDSSLIAALAARRGPLSTISMGFASSDIDERPQARAVAEFIGSQHTEVTITPQQVMAEVESGAWVFDDLFADWGTITTRLMYRRCREQGLKVVLVGEGADELFGGYDIFKLPARLGLWQQFRLYQRYCGRRHGELFGEFHRIMGAYLEIGNGSAFDAVRLFESRRQLPNQYVMKVDKASMAESMEARAPYLDRRVAELAYRTPESWLQRDGQNKYLLRALARREGLLSDSASQRPKFGAPLAAGWMDDDPAFRAFARERVLEGRWCQELGLAPAMRSYFDQGRRGYAFPRAISLFRNLAWRLLLLELWSEHYLAGDEA